MISGSALQTDSAALATRAAMMVAAAIAAGNLGLCKTVSVVSHPAPPPPMVKPRRVAMRFDVDGQGICAHPSACRVG